MTSVPLTTSHLLSELARTRPGDDAVVDGGLRLTWAQLDAEVTDAAAAYVALGVRPGERVALWAPNCAGWVVAALGAHRAGAAIVPVNTRLTGREAAELLASAGVAVLVTVTGFLGRDYAGMLDLTGLPELREIVDLELVGPARSGVRSWSGLLDSSVAFRTSLPAVAETDLADVLFTSGTTGVPRPMAATHAQSLSAFAPWVPTVGLRPDDRYLIVSPFAHTFGYKAGVLACLLTGATMIPERDLSVAHLWDVVGREQVTVLPGTPALYVRLLEHQPSAPTSLRLAVTGGATIPPALVRRIRTLFPHVTTGYGLTETCGLVSVNRWDESDEVVATTAGRPMPGLSVQVVDGELRVRGACVLESDADGWLHTGDAGFLDDAGRIVITDRIKEIFIVGGYNVSPAEVERVLCEHPAVAAAAVLGVPDPVLGEVGHAVLVSTAPGDEVLAWAKGKLASYKLPRTAVVLDSLPLGATGKVDKSALRELVGYR